jgi:hypothetical protein
MGLNHFILASKSFYTKSVYEHFDFILFDLDNVYILYYLKIKSPFLNFPSSFRLYARKKAIEAKHLVIEALSAA